MPLKPKKRKRNIEDTHQRAVINWSRLIKLPSSKLFEPNTTLFDYLFHVPNGGGRSKAEAGILKSLGVKAGVSDLVLAIPTTEYSGLYLEMKPPKLYPSRVSETQKQWKERMNRVGYFCDIAYGSIQAQKIIADYLREHVWIRGGDNRVGSH
nr:VRR-NUC domain-containing protein [Pleionea sediminis]